MGGAFTAIADDGNSVRWNPAGLARLGRYAFEFEQTPSQLFGELSTNYLSAAIPISEKSAFGIDWMQVGIDDDELDAKQNRFNFSYSYRLFNSLSVGMNLKHFTHSISLDAQSRGAAIGWGTDIGAILQPNHRWKIGLFAQDFIGFASGEGVSRGTWIRHDTGVSEKVFSTIYKLGIAFHPSQRWRIATDINDRFHLGAEFLPNPNFAIRAGLQKDLGIGEPPTYSFGGGVKYKWLNFNVAYLLPPTLPPTTYAGLSLSFDFRKLPVRIERVRMKDLYPVHYHYYANSNLEADTIILNDLDPPPVFNDADLDRYYPLKSSDSIGRIWLKNESNKPITVQIKLFIDQFVSKDGTNVALADVQLPPQKRISVRLRRLVLSQQVLGLNHTQPVEAQIKVIESGGTAYRTATTTLNLHGNGTTRLDDVAKLASFIPSRDAAVNAFINQIRAQFREEIDTTNLPENLYVAMLLFNALHGISYATDANLPFGSGTIDEIKHPHQMLEHLKARISESETTHAFGDCDDSTALYSSLLESSGIKTALIQLPGHVLMAFDLGNISLEQAQKVNLPDQFYQSINGQVWIPIETTLIKDGFTTAWKRGSEELPAVIDSVTVAEGWDKYGPGHPRGVAQEFFVSKSQIQKRMKADLTQPWLQEFLEPLLKIDN